MASTVKFNMIKYKATFITLIFLLGNSVSLHAADLLELYQMSIVNDAELAAANAASLSRQEVIPNTRAQLLPNILLSANANRTRRDNDNSLPAETFNSHGYAIKLTQPVFRLDRWFDFKAAKALSKQAKIDFAAEQQALILRVADAYFNVLRAKDNLEFARAEESAVKRQLEQIEARFEVGLTAITDVYDAQASYDVTTVNLITSESDLDISYEALEKLTGSPQREIALLANDFPINKPEPSNTDNWVSKAIKQNLSIQSAEFAKLSAESTVKKQQATRLPTLDAFASYSHNTQGGTSFLGETTNDQVVGLELSVPIFQGGAISSNIRSARYDLEQSKQSLELTKRTVTQDTRRLLRQVNTDVSRIAAQEKVIQSSESALEATQVGYEVGTRNAVDVLQAQRDLYAAKRNYANAKYDFILNSLRLKLAVGTLSPDDLVELNKWLK